jgi:hypothetical protein
VAGSKKCRPGVKQEDAERREREEAERRERAREVCTAVRVVLMIWEFVWPLIREHVSRGGTGPGPLL